MSGRVFWVEKQHTKHDNIVFSCTGLGFFSFSGVEGIQLWLIVFEDPPSLLLNLWTLSAVLPNPTRLWHVTQYNAKCM